MESTPIRALIIDDEPLGREIIRDLLEGDQEVEILGECASGLEALRMIEALSPDLIFLDVQMPEIDGFAVLERLRPGRMPGVIFITAYDQYAVRAFDKNAVDYLLKPFDQERFDRALGRAKSQLWQQKAGTLNLQIKNLLEEVKSQSGYLERLLVKMGGRVIFVKTEEIDWIAAEGNYSRLHTKSEQYLVREVIGTLETQLDPKKFLRIHRSTIVQIDRIRELHPYFQGEHYLILRDGTQLTLSRSYQKRLQELFGRPL
jgi:two-component system LytT family response regulator